MTHEQLVEEAKKEFDERFGNLLYPDTDRWLCQYNEHLGYSDHHLEVRTFLTTAMQRAYEAGRADWLRSEIEKLEGEKVGDRPTDFHGDNDPQWWDECAKGFNVALDSIITRYTEELLELDKTNGLCKQ